MLQNQGTFEWPEGIQLVEGRMYSGPKSCVPTPLQKEWIRVVHAELGHAGFERTWNVMQKWFEWGNEEEAKNFTKKVSQECDTCQACKRPRNLLGLIVLAPIPPAVMANVAIDVFNMPAVKFENQPYDCMIVCVDRHSGWLIAVPGLTRGLTGAKVAKAMLKEWAILGVPARITSDQGSHFVNAWWKTMCAHLGITHIYTQPYHHQANGRAEMAGQQIKEVLRKLNADQQINWVEALPRAVRLIHDMPGESGLSPYEILFGRERFCARVPYTPPRECEDAKEFFERISALDEKIAESLNEMHAKKAGRVNFKRKSQEEYPIGTLVWYYRPENTGGKIDSRWLGPAEVLAREGAHSYKIRTGQNSTIKAHSNFLKKYWPDTHAEICKPMFFHKRTVRLPGEQTTQLQVEEIKGFRVEGDGRPTFLAKKNRGRPRKCRIFAPRRFCK